MSDSNFKFWSDEEIEALENSFHKHTLQHFSNDKTKTELIQEDLNRLGFERSLQAIRRKLFRRGLTDFMIKREIKIKIECFDCGELISVPKRYVEMYSLDNFRCDTCKEVKRREWSKTEKGKQYHKNYMKNWKVKGDKK